MSKEITRVICELGKEPIYITETLTDEQVAEMEKQQVISQKQERMSEILSELQQTDYKAIKFAEGQYTAEEYEPTKLARLVLRKEYNDLEIEIKGL